jgi:hypothetical protein
MNTKLIAGFMIGAASLIATPVFAQQDHHGGPGGHAAMGGAPRGGAPGGGGRAFGGGAPQTHANFGGGAPQAHANFAGPRVAQAPAQGNVQTNFARGGGNQVAFNRGGGRYHRGGGWGGPAAGFAAGVAVGSAFGGPYYNNYYDNGDPYAYNGYYDNGDNSYAYYDGPVDDGTTVYDSSGAPADVNYCIQTFRSYDVRTQTYLGFDGLRHSCP